MFSVFFANSVILKDRLYIRKAHVLAYQRRYDRLVRLASRLISSVIAVYDQILDPVDTGREETFLSQSEEWISGFTAAADGFVILDFGLKSIKGLKASRS